MKKILEQTDQFKAKNEERRLYVKIKDKKKSS